MDNRKNSLLAGGFLIFLGTLILLNNLDFILLRDETLVSVSFLALGGVLLLRHLQTQRMGTLIFSAILLFIGMAILIDSTGIVDSSLIGTLLFWELAALFTVGYLRNSEKWGLIIPAGILFTLGLIVLMHNQSYVNDDLAGGTFFLGLGLTFGLLYLFHHEKNKLEWARVAAIIFIIFSGFIYFTTTDSLLANLLLPATFIALGGYLVLKSLQNKPINKTA
jgi:hypothetical protein